MSMPNNSRQPQCTARAAALALLGLLMGGCDPLSLTMAGIGASTGIQHTLNGISYRTFTAPLPQVRVATVAALGRMGIKDSAWRKTPEGGTITAKAGDRDIEIEFDSITPNTTRMRTTVRSGMLMDSATGNEIIVQTERVIINGKEKTS